MKRLLFACLGILGLVIGVAAHTVTGPFRAFHFDFSGAPDRDYPVTPDACWTFETAVAGTYVDDCAATYTMTVNGSPEKIDDDTHPLILGNAQGNAWTFDGSTDYLSRADDGSFEPAGDFSVQVVVTPDQVSSSGFIMGKYKTADGNRGWLLFQLSNDDVRFTVSSDGAANTGVTKADVLAIKEQAFITVAYDYVADGSSVTTIYVNNETAATDSSQSGPVYNGDSEFNIGSAHGGSTKFTGWISDVKYFDGRVITEAEHDRAYQHWLGNVSGSMRQITTTNAASPALLVAPPDSGIEPFLRSMPLNVIQVGSPESGSGGLYFPAAITNLCHRASFESCTASGGTEPDGWTIIETPNAGTADAYCSTAAKAHGTTAVRLDTTADGEAELNSACHSTGVGSDVIVSIWAKELSGTSNMELKIKEYSNPACAGPLGDYTIIGSQRVATDWTKYYAVMGSGDWNVATVSYLVEVYQNTTAAELLVDAIQTRVSSIPIDAFCGADTDASAVCDDVYTSIDTPMTVGNWTITATVRSPVDGATGAPARWIMKTVGTSGNNNAVFWYWSSDTLTCSVYTAGGTVKTSTVAAAGNADTDYTARIYHTADGRVGCCWDSTCDATEATDAVMDDINSTTHFPFNTAGRDVWIKDLKFYNRVVLP